VLLPNRSSGSGTATEIPVDGGKQGESQMTELRRSGFYQMGTSYPMRSPD
jgi:hypothetical protein